MIRTIIYQDKIDQANERETVMNLFAYGTLMCSDIMGEVSGMKAAGTGAILPGYSRRCVRGQHYPGLIKEKSERVEGIIYFDIPDWAWGRLDTFEGDMYDRLSVSVETADKRRISAETYVVKDNFTQYLETRRWSFQQFLEDGKATFQRNYRGYEDS